MGRLGRGCVTDLAVGWTVNDEGTLGPMEQPEPPALDLDALETELEAVEASLERLDAGTYGICEVTGVELPDDVLVRDPTARRMADLGTP